MDVSWAPLGSLGHLLNDFLALGRVWGVVLEGFWKGIGLQNVDSWEGLGYGFGRVLTTFGEGFGRALEFQERSLGAAWSSLGCHVPLGPPRCHALRTQYAGVLPSVVERVSSSEDIIL